MPGTVLSLGNATVRKQTKMSAFIEFTLCGRNLKVSKISMFMHCGWRKINF